MSSMLDNKSSTKLSLSSLNVSSSSSSIFEKRGSLIRTSSIQKIKCSAIYPFRIAGTKFSKDAIKELFESLIIKGRKLSQQAFISSFIAIFKLINFIRSFWIGISILEKNGCDKTKEEKTKSASAFHERLFEKIQQLYKKSKDKDLLSSSSLLLSSSSSSKLMIKTATNNIEKFTNEIMNKTSPELTINSTKSTSGNNESLTKNYHQNNNNILVLLVYSSAIFIYLQLFILTIALNTTQNFPPGLLFLITSLFVIAIVIYKVFLIQEQEKYDMKLYPKPTTGTATKDDGQSSTDDIKDTRRTRTKNRKIPMLVDLNSKTLSKIKIL